MTTITLQIGNSDDKLKQKKWAEYVKKIDALIHMFGGRRYFFGAPPNYYEWQNATWIFDIDDEIKDLLKEKITNRRKNYMQDSVAWTEGHTQFI
jgi:hypothetical protein